MLASYTWLEEMACILDKASVWARMLWRFARHVALGV